MSLFSCYGCAADFLFIWDTVNVIVPAYISSQLGMIQYLDKPMLSLIPSSLELYLKARSMVYCSRWDGILADINP